MRDRSFLFGSLSVVLAAAGFGLLGPIARLAYERGLDPISFVAWRAGFASLTVAILVVGLRSRGRPVVNPFDLPRRDGLGLLLAGLSGIALNVAVFFAFDLATVAVVLLAFYTYPAMVAAVAIVLGHERLDRWRVAALGLATSGTVLVVAGGLGQSAVGSTGEVIAIDPLGVGLGFVAALSQTVFVTISRDRYRQVPTEQAVLAVMLMSATACVGLSLVTAGQLGLPISDRPALGLSLLAGVAAAGLPGILFLRGIRAIGGTRAGILMLLEPLVGVALAALLLHEALTPIQALGGAGILGGALLLQRAPRSETDATEERIEPAGFPSPDAG